MTAVSSAGPDRAAGTRARYVGPWRVDVSIRPGAARPAAIRALVGAIAAALGDAGAPRPASIGLVLTGDAELATLNQAHLGRAGPTDVLSFPLLPPDAFPPHPGSGPPAAADRPGPAFVLPPGRRVHLGDIVVSTERAIAQAEGGRGGQTGDVRWAPADETRLLVVHGALHICGWDHARPEEEAAMRALERRILGLEPPG